MTPVGTLVDLRAAVDRIWTHPPADLARLAAMHRPPSRDMPKRLYANFDLYSMAGIFYFFLRRLKAGGTDSRALMQLMSALAEECAGRLEKWGLNDAAAVLREAEKGYAESDTTQDALDISETLIIYVNRLHNWIDVTIPWSALDTVEPLDVIGQ